MQRKVVEFRTPQHPSSGSNNWGGASPLLARNLPKESLETKYLKLNSIRTRDEIFPANDDIIYMPPSPLLPPKSFNPPPTPCRSFLSKLPWLHRKKKTLGSTQKKKSRWLPDGDYRNRWPQGWC